MKRIANLHIILVLLLFLPSCASISKSKVKHKSHKIKLKQLESDSWVQVSNEFVNILLDFSDVTHALKENSLNSNYNSLIELLKNNDKPYNFENNLQLKNQNEASVFLVVWNLLKIGKAKVFYKNEDVFVNEIEFVKVHDINGEQEYFKIVGGDIFLSKIISLGE